MALSGTVNTTSYQGRYLSLTWTATQNISTNKSTISWTLKGAGASTSTWYMAAPFKVVINGTTVYNNSARIQLYNGTKVASGTLTISHGADGKKSFTASVEAAIYLNAVNCTGSKSFTLDTIPRAAKITSAESFNDEENPTIKYNNYAGSNVSTLQACISFDGSNPDVPYRDISKTGTSYTFNLTSAERKTLRAGTKSESRTVYFYIKTVIDGNTFYNKVGRKFTLINCLPTLNPTVSVSTSSTTYALTGSTTKFIKGITTPSFTTGAEAKKEATIKTQYAVNASEKISGASGKFGAITSGTFKFTATDNRGFTTTETITRNIVDYVKLTCNPNIQIGVDGVLIVKASGKYFNGSFGAVSNTLSVEYRYKESGGNYTSWKNSDTVSLSGNSYTSSARVSGLNYQKKYTVEVRAVDKLYTIAPSAITVKATPVFDWGENDFKFNVPVEVDTLTSGDNNIDVVKLAGMVNLLSNNYTLTTTLTAAGNWSGLTGSALISGGVFRFYLSAATRSSAISGNIANEKICTVRIKHDGKIKSFYNVSFVSGSSGALCNMYTTNVNQGDTELSFDIYIAAAASSTTEASGFFVAPVSYYLDKFI